jgi:hypothetical protein
MANATLAQPDASPKILTLGAQIYVALIALITVGPAMAWVLHPLNAMTPYGITTLDPRAATEIRVAFGAQGVGAGLYMALGLLRGRTGLIDSLRFLTVYLACVVPVRILGAVQDLGGISHYQVPVFADGSFLVISAILWWAVARRRA